MCLHAHLSSQDCGGSNATEESSPTGASLRSLFHIIYIYIYIERERERER